MTIRHDEMSDPNSPENFLRLSEAEQACLLAWIALAIQPATVRGSMSSYGLKHAFEELGGFYATNGEWKGAMCAAGYAALDEWEINWHFRMKPTRERTHWGEPWASEPDYCGYGIDQATRQEQSDYLVLRSRCARGKISIAKWRHIFGLDEDEKESA
jgi:hypothetical protein